MNLNEMTNEQKAALKAAFAAEEKEKELQLQQEREAYKEMVDKFCKENLTKLESLSLEMMRIKQEIFEDAETLIKLKDELFKTKMDRRSNTFTSTDSTCSITLGQRVNEGWDDTVDVGIEKVKAYLATLAKDDNSAMLVNTVMGLLAKDRKGALKANKVLELERLATDSQNSDFLDGIRIIKESYRPVPTCQFIEVEMKNEQGNPVKLPLSLAAMK